MLKIQPFGIKNFRSFDENGIFLDEIKKINIFIGKNNSGKSTLLRFLKYFAQHSKKLSDFPHSIEEEHRRNGKPISITLMLTHEELGFSNFNRLNNILPNPFICDYFFRNNKIQINENILKNIDTVTLIKMQKQYSGAPQATLIKAVIDNISNHVERNYRNIFNNVIYIPHFRVVNKNDSTSNDLFEIDGSNIISKMFEMQNPSIGQEFQKEQFIKIQKFVRELLKLNTLEIEIPHTKDNIFINMHNNRLPLESFGTGIHQLVILCSALVMNENKIVCIEEPEIHLHPELQRKFLDFLIEETNNIYFISTHSNVFVDFHNDLKINHVLYDGISTKIEQVNSSDNIYEVLNDLGYKNSDLLQSNGIIWVEGPSDRIYLNKWLSIVAPELEEGLHYTIMFYGGKLLSHLTLQIKESHKINGSFFENDLIELLKINRNAYVFIDRDGQTTKASLNRTKKRIKGEIGNSNWITKGREVENYLTENTINKWLETKDKTTGIFVNNINYKIEDSISKVNTNIKYNLNKSKYSKEIIEYIDNVDLDILDLRKNINLLIAKIKQWNK
ncbi:MAG: AAA family ATPase [Arcobacteraceae bacterium]|nr:AAA family ATPase [Arcobacteraceae bacterium]